MLLKGLEDAQFELKILGYQSPHIPGQKYEANWLRIQSTLQKEADVWTYTGVMLLTWEVEDLIKWLDRLSRPALSEGSIGFTEPYLRFKSRHLSDNLVAIQVFHENIFLHTSISLNAELTVRREALKGAVMELIDESRQFPMRDVG